MLTGAVGKGLKIVKYTPLVVSFSKIGDKFRMLPEKK